MKVLVCMSVVPDTTTKIQFNSDNTELQKNGVQFIINPYDELAITKGLEIAEANNGSVTVIHVGPAENDPSIRKALSMGVNEAIRVDSIAHDAQFVAHEIAQHATGYDLILTGRESIDFNGGAVCGLLAAELGIPSVNVVTEIQYADGTCTMTRDIDGGRETVSCPTPCVASAQKDLCEPRIPNMRGIMAARTKPLNVVEASGAAEYSNISSFESPAPKSGVKMIDADNAEELINILKNDLKVI
ncbi:MAG: electron transfer flavoprotein subunit beta/FixA family protein [Bacteroidia bacterium]